MKFEKEINGEKITEVVTNKNLINLYERNGFRPVEEDEELAELKEKAKALGIKGYHNMKVDTLIEKIAEAEK